MTVTQGSELTPADLVQVLVQYRRRWIVPTVAGTVLAAIFALVRPETWEASQALIVRNEAATGGEGPGRFRTADDMKTIQETILEIAKSASVLTKTLAQVGPPADYRQSHRWPTPNDVDDLRSALKIEPPKGAEFGKTEIFYLKLRANSAARAVALATALSQQVQERCRKLREDKADSMIAELEKADAQSHAELAEATARLSAREQEVGSDLGELRMLQGTPSGESELRRRVVEVEHELREARNAQRVSQELLELLAASQEDPGRLLATPNRLLESQPALKRLKDGLVDAQLRTAELRGTMSSDHPRVRAAMAAEQEVSQHIHEELALAIKGVQVEFRLTSARVAQLEEQRTDVHNRLDRLASLRADYANLVAEVDQRTKIHEQVKRNLSDARASREGALTTSLIAAVDAPETGSKPVGPGPLMIVAAGLAGGLALGGGILFLSVPTPLGAPHDASGLAEQAAAAPVLRETVAAPASEVKIPLGGDWSAAPAEAASRCGASLKQAFRRLPTADGRS